MPLANEPTFREYLRDKLIQPTAELGGTAAYRRLDAELSCFGIKVNKNNSLSVGQIEELLSGVSTLVIHEDPLSEVSVGQQIAYGGESKLFRIYKHLENATNLASYGESDGDLQKRSESDLAKLALSNVKRVNQLSDKCLEEWLKVVATLDSKGIAVDTFGKNIMHIRLQDSERLAWCDVDDDSIPNAIGSAPEHHNHLEAIEVALRQSFLIVPNSKTVGGGCPFDSYLQESCVDEQILQPKIGEGKNPFRSHAAVDNIFEKMRQKYAGALPEEEKAPEANLELDATKAFIQEEYAQLHERLCKISEKAGVAKNHNEYRARKNATKAVRNIRRTVVGEISIDEPFSVVAQALNRRHGKSNNHEL